MKRLLISAVMLMSLSSLAIMAVGQESPPPQEQARVDNAESIIGVVTNLDTAKNQVTVMTQDQKEISFTIDADTKVTKGTEPSSPSELKKGQEIKAEVQNSKAITISISM